MSYIDHNFVPADDTRTPRQRRLVRAQMTDSYGAKCDIVVRNVSDKGLGATTQGVPPLKGTAVTVTIPQGLEMKGTVRWVGGSGFGIEFDEVIDLDTLTQVIQRKHETANREGQWEVRSLHQINSGHVDPSTLRKI